LLLDVAAGVLIVPVKVSVFNLAMSLLQTHYPCCFCCQQYYSCCCFACVVLLVAAAAAVAAAVAPIFPGGIIFLVIVCRQGLPLLVFAYSPR